MVLMRCFCAVVLCYDHCHFYLLQRQEGEKGCECAEEGEGSSAEDEIW